MRLSARRGGLAERSASGVLHTWFAQIPNTSFIRDARARETFGYPFSCMPQWLLKPLHRCTPHMCASAPVKRFEQPLSNTREKVHKSVPRSSVLARTTGAGGWLTTPGVRAHTYGTASVPDMCRTPFTASARPLAPEHPTSYACRAVATARGMMRGLHSSRSG